MKVCITAESARNFMELFNRQIPELMSNDISADEILQKLYENAFEQFSGKADETKIREVLLQHIGLGVVSAMNYLQAKPSLMQTAKATERLSELQKIVLESLFSDEGNFGTIIDVMSTIVKTKPTIVPFRDTPKFNAVSLNFGRTTNQTFLYIPGEAFSSNIADPKKQFEALAINRLFDIPNTNFRLMKVSDLDSSYVLTVPLNDDAFVLVPFSDKGPVRFDNKGNVVEEGRTPVFTFKQSKEELTFTLGAYVEETIKANSSFGLETSADEVLKETEEKINEYIDSVNAAKSLYESGSDVNFEIDLSNSNRGFVESNRNIPTDTQSIKNIDSLSVITKSNQFGTVYFLTNSDIKSEVPLFEKSWLSLKEDDLKLLHYLLTNNNPTVASSSGKVWESTSKNVARTLLNSFINTKRKSGFAVVDQKAGTIQLFDKLINLSDLTLEDLKWAATYRGMDKVVSENTIKSNSNVSILESSSKVTQLGQWYYDNDGNVREALGIRKNFGAQLKLDSSVRTVESFDSTPGSEKIIMAAKDDTLKQHVIKNTYVVANMNGDGELKGAGAYFAFKPKVRSQENLFKFFSESIPTAKGTNFENEVALDWFKNSPLSKVVKTIFSKEYSEKGPAFLASFIGNTINMYKGAEGVLLYHEAFHAFFNGILSEKERTEIYDEVRLRKGKFNVTVNGISKNVNYSDASDLEIEEFLAEEFRGYATGKSGITKQSKLKTFFDKIIEVLNKLFGKARFSDLVTLGKSNQIVNSLFADLYSGNFDISNYDVTDSSEKFASFELENERFSHEEMNIVDESMDSVLSYVISNALNSTSSNELAGAALTQMFIKNRQDENSPAYIEAQNQLELNQSVPTGSGIIQLTKPNVLIAVSSYLKSIIESKKEMAKSALKADAENRSLQFKVKLLEKLSNDQVFGTPELINDYLQETTPSTILSRFVKRNPFFNRELLLQNASPEDTENFVDENNQEVFVLGADQYNNDVAEFKSLQPQTQLLLSSIQEHSQQGIGNVVNNMLGFPRMRSMAHMQFKLNVLLKDSVDDLDMCRKLREAAKTDKEIDQVYKLLGDLEIKGSGFSDFEHKQWNDFYQSFNKTFTPFRTVVATKTKTFEKQTSEDGEKETEVLVSSELTITTGEIGQDRNQVIQTWKANFNYILESGGPYVETDETGRKYINLEYLINDYTMASDQKYTKYRESIYNKDLPRTYDTLAGTPLNTRSTYSTSPLPKASWDMFSFLNEFGISLEDDNRIFFALLVGDESLDMKQGTMNFLLSHFNNILKSGKYQGTKFIPSSTAHRIYQMNDLFKQVVYDVNGRSAMSNQVNFLKKVSEVHYAYSNDVGTFMAFNAEGNRQNQLSYPSSLNNTVKVLNNIGSYDELINTPGFEHFDVDKNILIGSNPVFQAMFPNLGERSDYKIKIELLAGSKYIETKNLDSSSKSEDIGIGSFSSDEITKFISDIALTFDNAQETPRAEAKNTSVAIGLPVYKRNQDVVHSGKQMTFTVEEVSRIMSNNYENTLAINELGFNGLLSEVFAGHLEAELLRINEIKKATTVDNLLHDANYLNRGLKLQFFDDILPKELVNRLEKLSIEDTNDLNIEFLRDLDLAVSFEMALKEYFLERSSSLQENKLDVEFPEFLLEKVRLSPSDNNLLLTDRMILTFLLNNTANNLNYSTFFLGDFSNYKMEAEDYSKRIAGFISTGKGFRFSEPWLEYINRDSYEFAKQIGGVKTQYDGTLNTAVIAEKKTASAYIDHYIAYTGLGMDEYSSMDEADGQGWIAFDAYRILCKSSDEWSDAQERLYKKILKGEPIEMSDINTTYPVRKFQFYGNVTGYTEDIRLPLTAFYKYSLAPLIPGVIKNTPLEKLHSKMMEQGVDYVTMESGSKLSKVTPVEYKDGKFQNIVNVYYNEDRSVNDALEFTINSIHTRFLKNQLYLAEGYKGKITLPTQLRKIILLGIMDNGIPMDYSGQVNWNDLSEDQRKKESKLYNWFVRYNNNLKSLTDFYKDQLKNDLGLVLNEETGFYEGDSRKLIEYVKTQLEDKELLEEEIDSLRDINTGELINDLSLSLQSAAIEKLLMSMVDKKLRRLKVNGEALVQVSGAMQEALGLEEVVDKEGKLRYGSNQLATYHAVDEDGNPVMTPDSDSPAVRVNEMEVMISLQGNYLKLLDLKHSDGKKIKVFTKGKLNYELSLNRLNEMMSDEEFIKENKSFLILPGVRIPTQGPNSLTVPRVKKFLPQWAGPVIILPSEIVAQAGSDFDIDKLYSMMKNIAVYNGKVELIEYKPTADNIEQIKLDLKETKSKLNQKRKEIKFSENTRDVELNELYKMYRELDKSNSNSEFITELIESQKADILEEIKLVQDDYSELNEIPQKEIEELQSEIGRLEKIIDGNSVKGIENEFMDLVSERTLMLSNFKALITPNSAATAKKLSSTILEERIKSNESGSYNKRAKKYSDSSNISRTEPMMYEYNLYKQQENSVGMDALGILAVVSTFNSVFRTMDASLQQNEKEVDDNLNAAKEVLKQYRLLSEEDQKKFDKLKLVNAMKVLRETLTKNILLPSNRENGITYLGGDTDVNNESIANTISQLIDGTVDVAKDAWIFLIEGNKDNTPVLVTMIMAGVPLEEAVRMSVHPLVRAYTKMKQSLAGPYVNLSEEGGIVKPGEIKARAQSLISRFYTDKVYPESQDFNLINNMNDVEFTLDELETLSKKTLSDISKRDVELFAQYLHIEKISDELTELTGLTKYDTQKIATTNDAQKRIDDTARYKMQSVNSKFLGNKFLDALSSSVTGLFNNDMFISHMFDKQFGIRNNAVLTNLALQITKKNIPDSADIETVRTQFKNDFILFLYQNSIYSGDNVSVVTEDGEVLTYEFTTDQNVKGVLVEDNKVIYNPNTALSDEISKSEYSHVRPYFLRSIGPNSQQIKNFIAFKLNYEQLLSENLNTTEEELAEKFYMFDKSDRNLQSYGYETYKRILLQRAAMFNARNPESMFDSDLGIVPCILRLRDKYKELQNYSLIKDMRWDYDKGSKKYNLFYPDFQRNPEMLKLYKENLAELSNHSSSEVRSIFNEAYFSHLGIMQTGLSRNVKHDIARIGNPRHLQNELLASGIASKIEATLNQAALNFENNKKEKKKTTSDYLILSQYLDLYKTMLAKGLYSSRFNGLNYTIHDLNFVETVNQTNSNLDVKVTLVSPKQANYKTIDFLKAEDLESFVKGLSELGSSFVLLSNEKLTMPSEEKQLLLDQYLDKYLNVSNKGDKLKLINRVSFEGLNGGLNLGPVLDSLKSKNSEVRYGTMAANSTKALLIPVTPMNSNYTSSMAQLESAMKVETELNKNLNPKSFSVEDIVMIAGESIQEKAYAGYKEEDYKQRVNNTFALLQKQLDKIVKAKATVIVSPLSGIDELVKTYFESNDYMARPVYKNGVKYYEMKPYNLTTPFSVGRIYSGEPLSEIIQKIKSDEPFISELKSIVSNEEALEKLFTKFKDIVLSTNRPGFTTKNATYQQSIGSEIFRLSEYTEIGLGKVNELFEQMFNRRRKKLHEGVSKANATNGLAKNTTFDELEEFSSEQKTEILNQYLKKYPNHYKSLDDVKRAIDSALLKDREGTLYNLKNCR